MNAALSVANPPWLLIATVLSVAWAGFGVIALWPEPQPVSESSIVPEILTIPLTVTTPHRAARLAFAPAIDALLVRPRPVATIGSDSDIPAEIEADMLRRDATLRRVAGENSVTLALLARLNPQLALYGTDEPLPAGTIVALPLSHRR